MKTKTALLLSALSLLAFAACQQSDQPQPKQTPTPKEIAREGEMRDDSLENRENRAGDMGDTQRQQNLENRQGDAENRQDAR